jgi:putative transcriptional regulator
MERWSDADDGYLEGHLLIAMPGMGDPRFERAVIYLCAHSPEGAMGIRINQAAPRLTFSEVLSRLQLLPEGDINLPPAASKVTVHRGGPVETGRGFVLHSADYVIDKSTLLIDDDICLTATLDILRAIASGHGPKKALLALGYAGWGPGQLEEELRSNGWLHCHARSEILFGPDLDDKYDEALAEIGIDPGMLSSDSGSA